MDYVNYMDYVGGYHLTADQGCVWLYGCRSKSVGTNLDCGHSPALSVTHCADALAVCGVWRKYYYYYRLLHRKRLHEYIQIRQ